MWQFRIRFIGPNIWIHHLRRKTVTTRRKIWMLEKISLMSRVENWGLCVYYSFCRVFLNGTQRMIDNFFVSLWTLQRTHQNACWHWCYASDILRCFGSAALVTLIFLNFVKLLVSNYRIFFRSAAVNSPALDVFVKISSTDPYNHRECFPDTNWFVRENIYSRRM